MFKYYQYTLIKDSVSDRLQKNGRLSVFLEWGMTNGDYKCLSDGLDSVGKSYLLPPRPKWPERPLAWFLAVRKALGYNAADAPLALGHLYRAIFPENTELTNGWHSSDVDTRTLIRIVKTYFLLALG